MFDYRDPEFFGQLDEAIEAFSFDYWAFVQKPTGLKPDGSVNYRKIRYKVRGSLQAWKKQREWGNTDGINKSTRTGRFYALYNIRLNEGDMLVKSSELGQFDHYYKVMDDDDYDYGGVRQYSIERMAYDETMRYNFDEYIEEPFVPINVEDKQ